MEENIQFEYVTKDGKHHPINTPATISANKTTASKPLPT